MFYIDWDDAKAAENLEKHGIAFEAASIVFDDPFHLLSENLEFEGEQRYDVIGSDATDTVLHVTYIDMVDGIDIIAWIISARKATPQERRRYEQSDKTDTWNTT